MIQSGVSGKGYWFRPKSCAKDSYLNGFRLRQQAVSSDAFYSNRPLDRTGANDIEMFCTDGEVLHGNALQEGVWSHGSGHFCQQGKAICGIESRVDVNAMGDELGLTEVRFTCCDLEF